MITNEYSSGNFKKHTSKNPLKKILVNNFNNNLVNIIQDEYNSIINPSTFHGKIQVLDMGCGEGFISNILYNEIQNCNITGIDFDARAIEEASKTNKGIDFIVGSIYRIPFEDNYFQFVVCTEVLEHLEKPIDALKELVRVTSTSGVLIISVPNEPFFSIGNLLSLKNITRLGNPIDHINHWTKHDFKLWTEKYLGKNNKSRAPFPWTIIVHNKI